MNFISFNGKIVPAAQPILTADNKGYRYGDGLFETMKVCKGQLLLSTYHFQRLFDGLSLLKIKLPALVTPEKLLAGITGLCQKNKCAELARVRLSVYRGTGGLYEENNDAGYIIECWPLDTAANQLNVNGLVTGIFPGGRKSADSFSHLKSAGFLLYSMAAQYAREHRLNDCIVLNTAGNIADSSIANVFAIKGDKLFTPALSEGCVAGTMRLYLLNSIRQAGMQVEETTVSPLLLAEADEIFLTNAVKGIRWIKELGGKTYTCDKTVHIYNRFVKTIFT